MTPAEVPAELVQQVADIILSRAIYEGREGDGVTQEDREDYAPYGHCLDAATCILAAVLPEIQAQAQQDLITDLLTRHLWPVRHDLNEYPIEAVPKSVLLEHRNRIARLAATTEEPT